MKIDKLYFENNNWILDENKECDSNSVDIVFVFGDIEVLKNFNHTLLLKKIYPNAHIVGSSSSANILDDGISDYGAVATAVSFETGKVKVSTKLLNSENLQEDAKSLLNNLDQDNLKHIFVITKGLETDGSEFVKGLSTNKATTITGGLAADGNLFKETYVFADERDEPNLAVAVGFYGDSIHVGIGCKAGWEEFGASRIVTKAIGNTIYEIDDKPVMELYERYLGDYIKDLPASGLNFPLSVKTNSDDKNEVIRVIMGINEDKSMVFAGDIIEGSEVRLMKTNVNNLIDGAALVADIIEPYNDKRSLALTVSCSGRLSVLKQLASEEIDAMHDIFSENTQIIGFYSYGEIAPFSNDLLNCKLHNQTMTATVIYED